MEVIFEVIMSFFSMWQSHRRIAMVDGLLSSFSFNHAFGQHSHALNRQPALSRNLACSVAGRMTVAPRPALQISTQFSP